MEHLCKLVVIGSPGVGKTSLVRHYVDREFTENYISTIGVDFRVKTVEIPSGLLRFQIWDTAGQERFRSITTSYYRGANVVILVYDVTNRQSFSQVEPWLVEIRRYTAKPLIYLVGNKIDLTLARTVLTEEGRLLAQREGLEFTEISAKTDLKLIGVFFETIARRVAVRCGDLLPPALSRRGELPRGTPIASGQGRNKCPC